MDEPVQNAPVDTAKQAPTEPVQSPQEPQNTFSIPDEYKERGWASKVKSQDDLFKQIDNLDQLAGKKRAPFDYTNATEQQIEDYHGSIRPQEKTGYDFFGEDAPKESVEFMQDLFFEAGISKYQAQKVFEKYSQHEAKIKENAFSEDGFHEVMKGIFGDKFQETGKETAEFISKNLNKEDQEILKQIPNQYIGLVYKLADNVRKAYGASEGDASLSKSGGQSQVNVDEVRKGIMDKLNALKRRPHATAEKQVYLDQLKSTYK